MSRVKQVYYIDNLEVVGFADFIVNTSVPRRVAPIFKFKNDDRGFVFPPFRLIDELILGGKLGSEADFVGLIEERNATKLLEPIDAQRSGMLWIDENLEVHYGIQEQQNKILIDLAVKRLLVGYRAFELGDFQTALSCARWASAANQRSLNALVLEAAIYRISDNESGLKLIKQMSTDVPDGNFFNEDVRRLVRLHCRKEIGLKGEYLESFIKKEQTSKINEMKEIIKDTVKRTMKDSLEGIAKKIDETKKIDEMKKIFEDTIKKTIKDPLEVIAKKIDKTKKTDVYVIRNAEEAPSSGEKFDSSTKQIAS